MKTLILIDGSNFYHKLKDNNQHNKKFDYEKFCKYIAGKEKYSCVYYVGAIRQEKNNKKSRKMYSKQRSFLANLEKQGLAIYRGHILKTGSVYHEKGVDVKIAVDLLVGAYENTYKKAFLVSSDTDLIPAIEKAISRKKDIEYIGFSHSPSYALIKTCTSSRLLSAKDIETFLK